MYMLRLENLSKIYKGKKGKKVTALTGLTLSIARGEVFGFLGPNGAGKSTTIKSIMGLIRPTSGSIITNGLCFTDPQSRRQVGYLPENPSFYEFLTGREYLEFVGRAFQMPVDVLSQRVSQSLSLLELSDAADRPMRGYSKGMVQRLGLAQTLLHDPELYVLDEPMSGLDPIGRALVKDIVRDLKRKGKTVFFSTHITADVEAICDRVGIIVGGRLQAVESVENIMQSGIEGYSIQVKGLESSTEIVESFSLNQESDRLFTGYVPKECFNEFMQAIIHAGAVVELIETKRKDLEAFFLAIAAKETR